MEHKVITDDYIVSIFSAYYLSLLIVHLTIIYTFNSFV